MRALLFASILASSCLIAEDNLPENSPAAEQKITTEVHPDAVPSLVNLTALPSTVVNGSVNVITGDYCDTEQDDVVSGPDPYVLGHSYCSSSLEEGNLGDGWNFLHYHFLEVYQPGRIKYVRKGPDAPNVHTLYPINFFDKRLSLEEDLDVGISPFASDAPLEDSEPPYLVAKGMENRGRDRHAKRNKNRENRFSPLPRYEPLYLSLYEPSGGRLLFKAELDSHHKERSMRHFKLVTKKSGYTNVMGSQISAHSNLKNIRISWDKEDDRFTVIYGDGTQRIYERQWKLQEMEHKDHNHAKFYRDYQLKKEIKPSGNIVVYRYNDKHEITEIVTYNKDTTHKLNWVTFEQKSKSDFIRHPSLHVKTSDKLEHVYYFKKLKGSVTHGTYSVAGIKRQGWPYIDYSYSEKSARHKQRVSKKEFKDHSYSKTKYYRWEDNQVGSRHVSQGDKKQSKFLHNRVRLQKAPVGPNGKEEITHRYFYYKGPKGGGHTTVRQPYGLIKRYYWNKDKRLTSIKTSENTKLLKTERFYWGEEGSHDEGRLLSYVLFYEKETPEKKSAKKVSPKLARVFEYDSRGNVLRDSLYGRFTENSGSLRVNKGFPHHESCDEITTKYTYSDDGFNLKTSERDPNGNYTYYEYVKGTNLLKAKLICAQKETKKREFFRYDENAIMIEHIIDDGSSDDKENLKNVTERHITRITPRTERPHFGEAEVIEECYLDLENNKEVLLTKTQNHFNDKGFVVKKTVIAEAKTVYEYDYDDVGRLIYSKDPLGQEVYCTYNKAGLLASKRGPRQDVTWHYTYDKAGRLTEECEEQEHGVKLKTHYEYDLLSRKISETNPQGHTTRYKYDALNRITEISYPITYDYEGKDVRPTKSYTYNALGTEVVVTDENNYQTITTYNALGKITSQKFHDGTEKKIFYDLKGNVVKEISQNKTVTHNKYDAFNRLKSSRLMKGDTCLSTRKIKYNSFHPVKEIGPCKETTTYRYDFAGRKVASQQDDRLTTYDYDAKGRLQHEKTHLSDDTWIGKHYAYDDLDRVICEKNHDSTHKVCSYKIYGYDAEGNRSSIIQNIDGHNAETLFTYKPHGMPHLITDAKGHQTQHRYFHFYLNENTQLVMRKDTIDARGCTDEERYDARNNLSEVLRFDPFGTLIAKKKLFYDASNNLLRIHESVIVNGQEQKQIITLLTYGPYHRLDSITEAADTPEAKTTRYIYNEYGQKVTTIYADGTKLQQSYDAKGRVERYFAEDGTVDYRYHYDASDRVLEVTNNLTNATTKRQYNSFGEIVLETLETGLTMHYGYDKAGRVQELTLPDNSKVGYDYSPTFLESIKRIKDEELYCHKITERDLSGNIKQCTLAQNAGTVTYNHDMLNRRTKTAHTAFTEETSGFDPVGNLLKLETHDPQGSYTRSFTYDFLSQLIEENGPTSHSYSYDSLHNRLSQDECPYLVNSLHSVLSDSKHTFTYDTRGNRTSKDKTTYKYDALDRLIEVHLPDKTFTYTYDALNRRLTKSDGVNTTKYLYAIDNEIGSMNSEGKITELRLLGEGLGAEIGASVAIELQDTLYIPIHDRQGNIATLLDAQGHVAESYRYDAFGNEATPSHTTSNPWRFSSKRVDEETGLVYFGRRYYDPMLGKWLTQDPLGLKAGPNLYAYVVNNPMTKFDLYGLLAVEIEKMNQLNGSSGFRSEASVYSHSDRNSGDYRNSNQDNSSQTGFAFDHQNGNTSPFSNTWESIKDKTPGILYDGLDAIDKLSFVLMLVPLPQTRLAGLGFKALTSTAKALIPLMRTPATAGVVKSVVRHLVHSNSLSKQTVTAVSSTAKSQLGAEVVDEFVNLASSKRTQHIIFGDSTGGGHLFPGAPGKTPFPATWSPDKIMHQVSDIVTDPKVSWNPSTKPGSMRFEAIGVREGVKLKVVIESSRNDIVTAFPIP